MGDVLSIETLFMGIPSLAGKELLVLIAREAMIKSHDGR
jgi:hypothetical protein